MSEFMGRICDLPLDTENNYIKNTKKWVVFNDKRFWPDYVLRCFSMEPGAGNSMHKHEWPHWSVCISGKGKCKIGDETGEFSAGVWAYIPGNVMHRMWNPSDAAEPMTFLCIVPPEGDVNPMKLAGC